MRAAFFISSSIFWQCSCIFSLLVSFEFWSILWNSGQLAFSVLKLSVGGDSSSSSSPIRVVKHGRWSDPPVSSSVSHLTASYGKLFVVIVRSIAVCDCFLVSAILVGSPVLIMLKPISIDFSSSICPALSLLLFPHVCEWALKSPTSN